MGYYINYDSLGNLLPNNGKAKYLVEHENATIIDEPNELGEGIVCVANIGIREVVIHVHNEKELAAVKISKNEKTWLILEPKKIKELLGY